ncbi:sugar-binding transcriptional regulator [Thalassospira lucentensis]|uniref:sugar-binding transcriptional regulator n=1 Tax=Thalassospira lucentensis TaxID=168935 RepID=UPI00142DCDE9|nr:sugar-binding transcriptional regulator [Thalassospira lucentensis]NIZ02883.1 sugar-binding transcriptional regulator [Thalassospira lucentensis]
MPREPIEEGEGFLTEVCWRYYLNGQTQAEVAREMGVTRLRVNQAIQKAKALGLVNIQIESPFLIRLELQRKLEQEFGISKALVVPADTKNYDNHAPVGTALAHYLSTTLKTEPWKKIGVSWGVTLQKALERLPYQELPDLEILALMGGTAAGSSFNAFSIASGFADRFNAQYSHLVAPIYLPEGLDKDLFLSQDIYASHIERCLAADAVLLVVGDVSDLSFMVKYGLPKDVRMEALREAGAVGDVLGRFLDANGNEINHPINDRTVGVDLTALAGIPNKILTAAGAHKVNIMRAAITRGLVDTLVTDDLTAEMLLETQ